VATIFSQTLRLASSVVVTAANNKTKNKVAVIRMEKEIMKIATSNVVDKIK